jgi:hypothetical protein
MAADPIPEQVYRDAAKAHVRTEGVNDGYIEDQIGDPPFRAAVESAYRAGYGQGRDDEAAALEEFLGRPLVAAQTWAMPDEPGPEVTAARLANGQILDHIGEDRWQYRVTASERKRGIVGSCTNWSGMVRMGPVVDASSGPETDERDAVSKWLTERADELAGCADDIERAARAAGKDKTDG